MIKKIKNKIYKFLRWSEEYTKTDMVYLAKGGFWLTLGKFSSAASALLLAIAFANLLSKENYGLYKYILSVAGILSIPTLTGMGMAATQAIAQGYDGSLMAAFKAKMRWGTLGSLGSIILSLYYYINGDTVLFISFLIIAVFLPLQSSLTIYGTMLSGKKLFKILSKYQIINKLIATSFLIITIFFTSNVLYILLAYFIPYIILRHISLKLTIKYYKKNDDINPKTIGYGKHLSLMTALGSFSSYLDKIMLWHYLGAATLAIYSFAQTPPLEIKGIFKNLKTLSIPKLSQVEITVLKKTLPKKILKLFIVIIPIIIIYILLTPYIFKFLFPQYMSSVIYSQVFSLVLLFYPTTLFNYALMAHMKKRQLYIINTTTNILKITLFLILLPLFGIWGAISSILIALLVKSLLETYSFLKL